MNSIIIVLTNRYPYGMGETFIEAERKYWSAFDKVYLCPVIVQPADQIREGFKCRFNEILISTKAQRVGLVQTIKGLRGAIDVADMVSEIKSVKGTYNKRAAFATAVLTNIRFRNIYKEVRKALHEDNDTNILVYSYWMYEPAMVALGFIKKYPNARFITRAHGYDLYEERKVNNYAPYRKLVLKCADVVYPISENGKQYLSERYQKTYDAKVTVSRLGTIKLFESEANKVNNAERIVIASCSKMDQLKRIDKIIDALRLFDKELDWFHFGDGKLMEELKSQASLLPDNIHVHFMGWVLNEYVQRFYSEHYVDVFVNVSETEGVPVSIMEAQSYGIPAVATDVGGTSEIIHDKYNGILLNKHFTSQELHDAIEYIVANSIHLRNNAQITWQTLSNAHQNYSKLFEYEAHQIVEADNWGVE